jgi:serine kinase of HPr protein (carbohydrate metabolism regulator)
MKVDLGKKVKKIIDKLDLKVLVNGDKDAKVLRNDTSSYLLQILGYGKINKIDSVVVFGEELNKIFNTKKDVKVIREMLRRVVDANPPLIVIDPSFEYTKVLKSLCEGNKVNLTRSEIKAENLISMINDYIH